MAGSSRFVFASTLTVVITCAMLAGCDAVRKPPPQQGAGKTAGAAADFVPVGPVTDAAHILKPAEIAALKDYLTGFDARTHHEMVIVTVPTLAGRDIDAYSLDLANRWGVGRNADDGIVVLLAPVEKQIRIEVGKGLNDIVTVDYCRHVTELMGPLLEKGRYFDAFMAGAKSIADVAKPNATT